jgi:enoyl-CoA hydratase/carnithine racemase
LRRVTSRFVEIEEDGGVTIVRLNRPPVNAIDPELAADGIAVLEELRSQAGGEW